MSTNGIGSWLAQKGNPQARLYTSVGTLVRSGSLNEKPKPRIAYHREHIPKTSPWYALQQVTAMGPSGLFPAGGLSMHGSALSVISSFLLKPNDLEPGKHDTKPPQGG